MSIADKLGFGPKRNLVENADGTSTLTVTPPSFLGYRGGVIKLTADQTKRYKKWLGGVGSIQQTFPDLPASQREIIMSGINDDEFSKEQERLGDPEEEGAEVDFA